MIYEKIVLDQKSARSMDHNGFMRLEKSPLTKEQVAPYRGNEIPDYEKFGLQPDKIYQVYRPASELSKPETLKSMNGIPIQLKHHIEDPDNPPKGTRIGATGTDADWKAPYVFNSLSFWDAKAIELINSNTMRELSLGYMYEPEFKPGKFNGKPYDFVMHNIRANHLALVEQGRAGPDVLVLDAQPENLTPKEETNKMESSEVMSQLTALQAQVQALVNVLNPSAGAPAASTDEDLDAPAAQDNEEKCCDNEETGTCDEGEDPQQNSSCDEDPTEDEDPAEGAADEDGDTEDEDIDAEDDDLEFDDLSPETQQYLEEYGFADMSGDQLRQLLQMITALLEQKEAAGASVAAADSLAGLKRKAKGRRSTSKLMAADRALLKSLKRDLNKSRRIAQDSAAIKRAEKKGYQRGLKDGAAKAKRGMNELFEAFNATKGVLGPVTLSAFDSAAAIYRRGAMALGATDLPKNADLKSAKAVFDAFKSNRGTNKVRRSQMGLDSAPNALDKKFKESNDAVSFFSNRVFH